MQNVVSHSQRFFLKYLYIQLIYLFHSLPCLTVVYILFMSVLLSELQPFYCCCAHTHSQSTVRNKHTLSLPHILCEDNWLKQHSYGICGLDKLTSVSGSSLVLKRSHLSASCFLCRTVCHKVVWVCVLLLNRTIVMSLIPSWKTLSKPERKNAVVISVCVSVAP